MPQVSQARRPQRRSLAPCRAAPPEVRRDARARGEGGAHARVDDHVEVALPVPLVDVGQPLPLVG